MHHSAGPLLLHCASLAAWPAAGKLVLLLSMSPSKRCSAAAAPVHLHHLHRCQHHLPAEHPPLSHFLLQSFGSPGVFVAEWAILATWLGTLFIV